MRKRIFVLYLSLRDRSGDVACESPLFANLSTDEMGDADEDEDEDEESVSNQ